MLMGYYDALYVILFSSLHEIGHLVCLYLCKGKAERLTLSFYGFGLTYETSLSRAREVLVLLSGPAINLILWLFLKDDINLILFWLNILPVYPLDGGRALQQFCSYRTFYYFSIAVLVILVILSLYLLIWYKIFSLFFIVIYLIVSNMRYL